MKDSKVRERIKIRRAELDRCVQFLEGFSSSSLIDEDEKFDLYIHMLYQIFRAKNDGEST